MMRNCIQFRLIFLLLVTLFILNCDEKDNSILLKDPTVVNEFGSLVFAFEEADFPAGTQKIRITISGPENIQKFDTIYSETLESVHFDSLQFGEWNIEFEALDQVGYVIYYGSTELLLTAESSTASLITFQTDVFLLNYFDEPQFWGGNAEQDVSDSVMRLTANGGTQWIWQIFDNSNPGRFTKGNIEFDLKIIDEGGYFDFRGRSISQADINWGPNLRFRDETFFANVGGQAEDTSINYIRGVWYHLLIKFDNADGDRGQYAIEINELGSEDITKGGPFDYHASNGRLADLVQFSYGAVPMQSQSAAIEVDNIKLCVFE